MTKEKDLKRMAFSFHLLWGNGEAKESREYIVLVTKPWESFLEDSVSHFIFDET